MAALLRALAAAGILGGAGCTALDVFDCDPPSWSHDLAHADMLGAAAPAARMRREGDRLVIATELAERAEDCSGCADRDGDGLSDEWEAAVLERVRPALRFDSDEPLFCDPEAIVGAIGRLARGPEPGHLRAFVAVFYTADYGRCTVGRHRGDVERVALDLIEDGPGQLAVAQVYTAAHEYTALDGSRVLSGEELGELELRPDEGSSEPRWAVYASAGKHATYASRRSCAAHSGLICGREDCADGEGYRILVPPLASAGEPDGRAPFEPPDGFLNLPIDPWSPEPFCPDPARVRDDGSPCGPGSIREKLLRDPFQPGQPELP